MKITFLGTGTSSGVPIIGCDCEVCKSENSRNRRLRTSIYLEAGGVKLVVDTTPDFREQCLRYDIRHIDAVLFTHSHADHIFGFDDIRRFNTLQGHKVIPAYAGSEVLGDLKRIFNYVLPEKPEGLFRPLITFHEITGEFRIGDVNITPLPVIHGDSQTLGFRFDSEDRSFAYVPDCLEIPAESLNIMSGADAIAIDTLRDRPHKTHMCVSQSVEVLKRVGAGQSYIVHLCHDLDHDETEARLPENIHVAWDGMVLNL